MYNALTSTRCLLPFSQSLTTIVTN